MVSVVGTIWLSHGNSRGNRTPASWSAVQEVWENNESIVFYLFLLVTAFSAVFTAKRQAVTQLHCRPLHPLTQTALQSHTINDQKSCRGNSVSCTGNSQSWRGQRIQQAETTNSHAHRSEMITRRPSRSLGECCRVVWLVQFRGHQNNTSNAAAPRGALR